ncbi:urease accessory protein UreJ [Variovorax paradoxus]|jgi:urease accessory protein|uniref:HupE/UreJ family protein n=1 Tax=Variovorax TaxID=34072 RepID=UPI0006E544AA|nr:urease accessory protein UreJ [Variovorax paradoxus]KPU97253.1 urease accessory protein UreJ [Variovorax paradoxus]KPV04858.1 urease accessory protein UreJ [Variovorax paradoxus]KPV14453.1 urease accessory protein UreJ [Variovorax paradoxus]KPV29475.1 urease accessory protein UreJ [Variovorax paradoxus]
MRPSISSRTLALLAAALLPLAASAHTGVDGGLHHGLVAGFMHPLTGADHLAAMVAVGVWSALSARRAWPDLLWAPLAFAGMLLAGALVGLAGLQLPAVEPMIAASLLVLGLLVAARVHLPAGVAMAVVGLFAVFHGVAHGHELAGEHDAALTLAGMVGATVLLHAAGIALGWALRHASAWLPRIAGAAVVGLGATLLAQAI